MYLCPPPRLRTREISLLGFLFIHIHASSRLHTTHIQTAKDVAEYIQGLGAALSSMDSSARRSFVIEIARLALRHFRGSIICHALTQRGSVVT